MKIRIKFSKYGSLKFVGHLDVMRYFQKAIRRAEIDIAYSEGYSPHPIMSFAAPLSVGHTSEGEYFDIEAVSFDSEEDMKRRLQNVMVEGIDILRVCRLEEKAGNAMASVAAASYLAAFQKDVLLPEGWQDRLLDFYQQEMIPVVKETKRGEKKINLKENIYQLSIQKDSGIFEDCGEEAVYMLLNASSGGNIKPSFVLESFFAGLSHRLPPFALKIHRLDTYQNLGTDEERKLVPLIWEK